MIHAVALDHFAQSSCKYESLSVLEKECCLGDGQNINNSPIESISLWNALFFHILVIQFSVLHTAINQIYRILNPECKNQSIAQWKVWSKRHPPWWEEKIFLYLFLFFVLFFDRTLQKHTHSLDVDHYCCFHMKKINSHDFQFHFSFWRLGKWGLVSMSQYLYHSSLSGKWTVPSVTKSSMGKPKKKKKMKRKKWLPKDKIKVLWKKSYLH